MMRKRVLLDTGTLVALLKKQDKFHKWAVGETATIEKPLLTCEAVIAEACYLLRNTQGGHESILKLLNQSSLRIYFQLTSEVENVLELMTRYQSVPMSLADACLVRMAEQLEDSQVFTLDSDFLIYRIKRNQPISIIYPL